MAKKKGNSWKSTRKQGDMEAQKGGSKKDPNVTEHFGNNKYSK
jgi:hypothetical protein